MTDDEWDPCAVCGARREVGAPSDAHWLWIEVERLYAPGWWQTVVCSEEHAAAWFGPPMPPPDHVQNLGVPETSKQRRLRHLKEFSVVLSALIVVAYAVVGVVSVWR